MDADSAEHGSDSKNLVIHPVACAVDRRPDGAPRLFGPMEIRLKPGSRLHQTYGRDQIREEFFCNYEVNPAYEARMESAGLPVVARGAAGEVRAVELPEHPFFIATLFQPQLSSRADAPDLLTVAFLRASEKNVEKIRNPKSAIRN